MVKRWTSLILVFVITCGSFSAGASGYTCESIFAPTLLASLEKIDQEYKGFVFQGNSAEKYFSELPWNRKRKIRSLLKSTHIGNFVTGHQVESLASELSVLLFGSREVVDRWLLESADGRLKHSAVTRINEELLSEGLLKIWGGRYAPEKISWTDPLSRRATLVSAAVTGFVNKKLERFGMLSILSGLLPKMKESEFPRELMGKIIRDGFDAHVEEARIALKAQTRVEAYNTFRRLYNTVFISATTTILLSIAYLMILDESDQRVGLIIEELNGLGLNLAKAIDESKEDIIQRAYERAEVEFIKKWGEKPTDEEKTLQLKVIREQLFPKKT